MGTWLKDMKETRENKEKKRCGGEKGFRRMDRVANGVYNWKKGKWRERVGERGVRGIGSHWITDGVWFVMVD